MKRISYKSALRLAMLLSLAGILITHFLYRAEKKAVLNERDEQLFSLAYSVDRNILQKMNELSSEMEYMLKQTRFQDAERDLIEHNDPDMLTSILKESHLFTKTALEGVVVTNRGQQLYSLNQMDFSTHHRYTFLSAAEQDAVTVCYDEQGKYSVALKTGSLHYGMLTYYILIDLNHFYDTVIPEPLIQSNWVVFYAQDSGLLLQNHRNQDPWMVLSEQEIRDRQDGYSIIMKYQLADEEGSETYRYPNYHGKNVYERIVVLPCSMTANGFFTIGISRDSESLYKDLARFRNLMLLIMLLLLIGGIMLQEYMMSYQHRVQTEEEKRKTELREAQLQHALTEAQLQNSIRQLQPHFLYNSLSSIREIVLESPEYAADLILDFTNFLRACLRALSTKELISFEQEMSNIRAYVNIEKMRLGSKLTVVYDIQETDFSVIPLGVQPLIENAIRHGISKKRGRTGTVLLRTCREKDRILILVEDDGSGFDTEKIREEIRSGKRDSTGIENLRKRYKTMMNAELTVSSTPGQGTAIRIMIPAEEK